MPPDRKSMGRKAFLDGPHFQLDARDTPWRHHVPTDTLAGVPRTLIIALLQASSCLGSAPSATSPAECRHAMARRGCKQSRYDGPAPPDGPSTRPTRESNSSPRNSSNRRCKRYTALQLRIASVLLLSPEVMGCASNSPPTLPAVSKQVVIPRSPVDLADAPEGTCMVQWMPAQQEVPRCAEGVRTLQVWSDTVQQRVRKVMMGPVPLSWPTARSTRGAKIDSGAAVPE